MPTWQSPQYMIEEVTLRKTALVATAAAILLPSVSHAQDMADTATEADGVAEIIVTATKRSESVQKVPISILTTTGDNPENRAVTSVMEITNTMPAVTIVQGPVQTNHLSPATALRKPPVPGHSRSRPASGSDEFAWRQPNRLPATILLAEVQQMGVAV